MPWQPLHEAHAIERVRLLIGFKEPLPSKVLRNVSEPIAAEPGKYFFDEVARVDSTILELQIGPGGEPKPQPAGQNGTVFRRHSGPAVVEELALRDSVFGYMTSQYGRWRNFVDRLEGTLVPPAISALQVADASLVKLEYWDTFAFNGDAKKANVAEVLAHVPSGIPEESAAGATTWHNHVGWFEADEGNRLLINQNFDAVDRTHEDGTVERVLNVYTLVEERFDHWSLSEENLKELLDKLHQRSIELLGAALKPEFRKEIGLVTGGD